MKTVSTLVFAPHQDDEVLGCGGTIRRLTDAGEGVHVAHLGYKRGTGTVFEKHGIARRYQQQAVAAAEILGCTVDFGTFPTEQFPEWGHELMVAVADRIKLHKPRRVFLPWYGDIHQDHRAVAEAARFGTRGFDGPAEVFYYEVPGSTEGYSHAFQPNVHVPLYQSHVDAKMAAFACYVDEQRPLGHPRSVEAVRARMIVHGSTVGREYAEAFQLARMTMEF